MALCGLCAPNSKLMLSDLCRAVYFMVCVVCVMGIHCCAAAWSGADPSVSASSHPGKHVVSVGISVIKLPPEARGFLASFTEIKASFTLLSALLLLSWRKMLQLSSCATIPMDWGDSLRITQGILGSAILRG